MFLSEKSSLSRYKFNVPGIRICQDYICKAGSFPLSKRILPNAMRAME